MSRQRRRAVATVVVVFVVVGLTKFFIERPSWQLPLITVLWILIWTPPKGALLRFMGGRRPNWSAFASNASSELLSLGFPLAALGFPWPALGISLALSVVVEGLVLVAMATGRVKACFIMALYVNVFSHMVVMGGYLWADHRLAAAAVILASFLLFILPIFVPVVPRSDP